MRTVAARLVLALAVAAFIGCAATALTFSSPAVALLTRVTHGPSAWRAGSSASGNTIAADAEFARQLVFGPAPAAPLDPAGIVGFDDGSVSHLRDVGGVVEIAIALAVALGSVLLVVALRRPAVAGQAFADGSVLGLGLLAAVALVASLWFEQVFVALHEALFTPGTWMFSADSLLIRTFPEPFWMASAAGWVLVAASLGALLWWLGRRLRALPVR